MSGVVDNEVADLLALLVGCIVRLERRVLCCLDSSLAVPCVDLGYCGQTDLDGWRRHLDEGIFTGDMTT